MFFSNLQSRIRSEIAGGKLENRSQSYWELSIARTPHEHNLIWLVGSHYFSCRRLKYVSDFIQSTTITSSFPPAIFERIRDSRFEKNIENPYCHLPQKNFPFLVAVVSISALILLTLPKKPCFDARRDWTRRGRENIRARFELFLFLSFFFPFQKFTPYR